MVKMHSIIEGVKQREEHGESRKWWNFSPLNLIAFYRNLWCKMRCWAAERWVSWLVLFPDTEWTDFGVLDVWCFLPVCAWVQSRVQPPLRLNGHDELWYLSENDLLEFSCSLCIVTELTLDNLAWLLWRLPRRKRDYNEDKPLIPTGTYFQIYSAYYLFTIYRFRKSCGA